MGKKMKRMEVRDGLARYYPSNALSLEQLQYWIAFSRVPGIGPVRFQMLLDHFHEDASAAWHADAGTLAEAGIDPKTSEKFLRQREEIVPQHELERLESLRIKVITWRDASYPPLLRKIEYAPPVLYTCGTLTDDDRQYSC